MLVARIDEVLGRSLWQESDHGVEPNHAVKAVVVLGVSEVTYHRWRNQYGGMKADDVKELKELRAENRQLKAIVADQASLGGRTGDTLGATVALAEVAVCLTLLAFTAA